MFKDFNIDKFKKIKPSSNNSFDTAQEVKAIKKIPFKRETRYFYRNRCP